MNHYPEKGTKLVLKVLIILKQGCLTNWKTGKTGKSGNLKIVQKSQGIWKLTKKSGKVREFHKIDSLAIEQASYQCWKQNVHLESHACDFSLNSRITYSSIRWNPSNIQWYLRTKIAHFKKYVMGEIHILIVSLEFCWFSAK